MKSSIITSLQLRPILFGCAVLILSSLPVKAAVITVDYTMAGDQTSTLWTNLGNTNMSRTPVSGTGTIAVASPGFQASAGLYAFGGEFYEVTTTQAASFDIENVVLEFDASVNPDFNWNDFGGPLLSYLVGSDWTVVPASSAFGYTGTSELRNTQGLLTYNGHAWQWDLSSISGTVTAVSIVTAIPVHTSVAGAFFEVSSDFNDLSGSFLAAAVPEPSRALLSVFALGLIAMRRKRRQ